MSSWLSHSSPLCFLCSWRCLEIPGASLISDIFIKILHADTALLTLKTQPVLQMWLFIIAPLYFITFLSSLPSWRAVCVLLWIKHAGNGMNSPAHGWPSSFQKLWLCSELFSSSFSLNCNILWVQYVSIQQRGFSSPALYATLNCFKKYKFSVLAWHHMINVWLY